MRRDTKEPGSFDESELAWFQGQRPHKRRETPAAGISVNASAEPASRSPWWQSLLDELDD